MKLPPIPDTSRILSDSSYRFALQEYGLAVAYAVKAECVRVCDDLMKQYWNTPFDKDGPDPADCIEAIKSLEIET